MGKTKETSNTGWIQASDYSSTDLGTVSYDQASQAIVSCPWDKLLHDFTERVLHKEDSCPPGVGFNSEANDCFHVYAVALNEWQLYISLTRPGKFLGLFRKPAINLHSESKTLERATELLRLFFDRDFEQLEIEAKKHPSREAAAPPVLG